MAVSMASKLPAEPTVTEYTRLHITPLNPTLLTTIIPSSILRNARNISYHSLQTFPERAYGFVELPTMDAENIKKKLNGSILKGTKVRIEKAKPAKELPTAGEIEEPARPQKDKKSSSKKRKRYEETIPGAEIQERSVKRGWTTPSVPIAKVDKKAMTKDKKKVVMKSKYTAGPECLFKTVLPPNVASNNPPPETKQEKKNRRRRGKESIVHEFSKTTKYATFLKAPTGSGNTKAVAAYVEGRGWVDQEGGMVEVVTKTRKAAEVKAAVAQTSEKSNSALSDTSENESSSEEKSGHCLVEDRAQMISKEDSPTSSSGSSSDDKESNSRTSSRLSSKEYQGEEEGQPGEPTKTSRPQSSSGLTIAIPATEVHPLEALFKRARPDSTDQPAPKASAPSFSFFSADSDHNEDLEKEAEGQVPLTPFTERDFEFRRLRSAAPTPDTAYASKRFVWPTDNDEDEEEKEKDEEDDGSPSRKGGVAKAKESGGSESDFHKWFYENRGETNRAWKKRRKMAAKEMRQRDNRKGRKV